jgi:hypothetical protein
MKKAALTLASVLAMGSVSFAQAAAPAFDIRPVFLTPSMAVLEFELHGPPNAQIRIMTSPYDPFGPASSKTRRSWHVQLDGSGDASIMTALQWQGPLPDVWFAAYLFPTAERALRARVQLAGVFNVIANSACVITNTKGRLDIRAVTSPDTTVSIWNVDCGLLPPEPAVGQPFNVAQAGVDWVDSGFSDSSGAFAWSGSPEPPVRCLVVMANGVIIGVMRR